MCPHESDDTSRNRPAGTTSFMFQVPFDSLLIGGIFWHPILLVPMLVGFHQVGHSTDLLWGIMGHDTDDCSSVIQLMTSAAMRLFTLS